MSENTAFVKRALRSPILSYMAPYFDICGVEFRLLLIAVAFCASQCIRLFASCLQIPIEGSQLQTPLYLQLFLRFLPSAKTLQRFHCSFLQIQSFLMASEGNRGKHAAEEILAEDMMMNQRLRRIRKDWQPLFMMMICSDLPISSL